MGSAHDDDRHDDRHDLVIRNGTVVDGTGAPGLRRRRRHRRRPHRRRSGGRPRRLGPAPGRSTPTACSSRPGWVDIHTHYDGQATWDDVLAPTAVARRHHHRDGQLRRRLRARPRPTATTG